MVVDAAFRRGIVMRLDRSIQEVHNGFIRQRYGVDAAFLGGVGVRRLIQEVCEAGFLLLRATGFLFARKRLFPL